jgi:hypothetical protein
MRKGGLIGQIRQIPPNLTEKTGPDLVKTHPNRGKTYENSIKILKKFSVFLTTIPDLCSDSVVFCPYFAKTTIVFHGPDFGFCGFP